MNTWLVQVVIISSINTKKLFNLLIRRKKMVLKTINVNSCFRIPFILIFALWCKICYKIFTLFSKVEICPDSTLQTSSKYCLPNESVRKTKIISYYKSLIIFESVTFNLNLCCTINCCYSFQWYFKAMIWWTWPTMINSDVGVLIILR